MAAKPLVNPLRAVARLVPLFLATVVLSTLYALAPRSARRWRRYWQIATCRTATWLLGLSLEVTGSQDPHRPLLVCANHVSYLDIVVLSQLAEGTFVAKSEIADWPLFGWIGRITNTIFVTRSPARAREQRLDIDRRLRSGDNLILFPEGTSTDGTSVLPFKSSLFDIVTRGPKSENETADAGASALLQPVSIAYATAKDGTPLQGELTELYCWYGGMTLAPHLWRVAGMRGAIVRVAFHPIVDPATLPDRKAIARACHDVIAKAVATAHGRGEVRTVVTDHDETKAREHVDTFSAQKKDPPERRVQAIE